MSITLCLFNVVVQPLESGFEYFIQYKNEIFNEGFEETDTEHTVYRQSGFVF